MSKTYCRTVCEMCGKVHSVNGAASTAHARLHVRLGDLTETSTWIHGVKSPRFEYTKQGSDKAKSRRNVTAGAKGI
jgi:hypothetical protein